MKKNIIKCFFIASILLTGMYTNAQTKQEGKYKAAKDYIKEKEETDPNMTRFPGDRTIKLDNKIGKVDTTKKGCAESCCDKKMKTTGKAKLKRKMI